MKTQLLKLSKFRNKKVGITLVEVVVSILILGITTGAIVGVFIMGKVNIVRSRYRIEAMNLTRARMEFIIAQNYSDIPRGTASYTATYPYQESDDSVIIDVGKDINEDGIFGNDGDELVGRQITQVESIGSPEEYLKITVTVTWTEHLLGGSSWQASERLVTYISQ